MNDEYQSDRLETPWNGTEKRNCLSKLWNWQPKEDYLALQLIRESNVHGVKYTAQPDRHVIERLFWIITVTVCSGVAGYLAIEAVQKSYRSPVIISFQPSQTSMAQIPFPAVTICNANRFRKSVFETALRMATNESLKETTESQLNGVNVLRTLDHICETGKSFSVKFNYSLNSTTVNLKNRGIDIGDSNLLTSRGSFQLLTQAFPSCEEMIPLCLWEGEVRNCTELFTSITTDSGGCCTFNMMPLQVLLKISKKDPRLALLSKTPEAVLEKWRTFDENYGILEPGQLPEADNDFPKHQSKAGQGSGLSFVLNPELDEYFCSGHNAKGFRIYPGVPIEWPHVSEFGMAVSPNSELFLSLQAEMTEAEDDIESLYVNKRHCYFLGEHKLKFFNYYTLSNCVDECIAKKILKNCGCIRYDLPQRWDPNYNFCEDEKFVCSENIIKSFDAKGTTKNCAKCLPSCNEVNYRAQTSSVPITDNYYIWSKEDNNNNRSYAKWAGKDVSIVHVFFGSDTAYSRVRKKLYGFNELLASVGGILSLFLGFSFMSLVEPLYFILRLCWEPRIEAKERTVEETETARNDGERRYSDDLGDHYYNQIRGYMGQQVKKPPTHLQFLN